MSAPPEEPPQAVRNQTEERARRSARASKRWSRSPWTSAGRHARRALRRAFPGCPASRPAASFAALAALSITPGRQGHRAPLVGKGLHNGKIEHGRACQCEVAGPSSCQALYVGDPVRIFAWERARQLWLREPIPKDS